MYKYKIVLSTTFLTNDEDAYKRAKAEMEEGDRVKEAQVKTDAQQILGVFGDTDVKHSVYAEEFLG